MVLFRLSILTLLFLSLLTAKAQQYELSFTGFGTGYMGDINQTNPLYIKNMGAGISGKYNFNYTWGIKLGLNHFGLSASDKDFANDFQQDRSLSFNNRISELSLTSEFNFFKTDGSRNAKKYTPYLLAGVSVIKHDPFVHYGQQKVKLRELKLEFDPTDNTGTYSKYAIATPFGIGVKHKLNNNWALGAELAYRIIWSDNIDNISKTYPTAIPNDIYFADKIVKRENGTQRSFDENDWKYLADPSQDLPNKAGTARGDGKKFDGLMTAGLTLTYSFISSKCYFW